MHISYLLVNLIEKCFKVLCFYLLPIWKNMDVDHINFICQIRIKQPHIPNLSRSHCYGMLFVFCKFCAKLFLFCSSFTLVFYLCKFILDGFFFNLFSCLEDSIHVRFKISDMHNQFIRFEVITKQNLISDNNRCQVVIILSDESFRQSDLFFVILSNSGEPKSHMSLHTKLFYKRQYFLRILRRVETHSVGKLF